MADDFLYLKFWSENMIQPCSIISIQNDAASILDRMNAREKDMRSQFLPDFVR